MNKDFYLLLDTCLCCAYAVNIWLEEFQGHENFKGVLLREAPPSDTLLQQRNEFHLRHAGQKTPHKALLDELRELYPYIDEAEEAMIRLFGIPQYSINASPNTFFLGKNINGNTAQDWVQKNIGDSQPLIFSHLGQIVKPWWIQVAGGYLFNVHSAVLPYARGINAIENVAASQEVVLFKQSAGLSIHLIDQGVDTGAIISALRVNEPFRFSSIWELKGYVYKMGYHAYVDVAKRFIFNDSLLPASIMSNPDLWGPNFKSKDFTEQQKRRAEEGYLAMQAKERLG